MRGGPRPGSGAPRGNFNALKHGANSPRIRAALEALVQDPNFRTLLAAARAGNVKPGSLRGQLVDAARTVENDPMAMTLSNVRRHRNSAIRRYAALARDRALEHSARDDLRRAVARYGLLASTVTGDTPATPDTRRARDARARLDRLCDRAHNTPGPAVHTSILDDPHSEWCVEAIGRDSTFS